MNAFSLVASLAFATVLSAAASPASAAQRTLLLPDPDLFAPAPASLPSATGIGGSPLAGAGGPRAGIAMADAAGFDNEFEPDFYGVSNVSSTPITAFTIDLGAVPGAFFDFDGVTNFGGAFAPIRGGGSYPGILSWTISSLHPSSITATLTPPLMPGEDLRFGADTDFFVSDPCPGGSFGTGPAHFVVEFMDGTTSFCDYGFVGPFFSEVTCGCDKPTLSVIGAVAGGTATIKMECATPFGLVYPGYSLSGDVPSAVFAGPCGMIAAPLSPPLTALPPMTADGFGIATTTLSVPPGTSGMTVWFAALDLMTCEVTDAVEIVVG